MLARPDSVKPRLHLDNIKFMIPCDTSSYRIWIYSLPLFTKNSNHDLQLVKRNTELRCNSVFLLVVNGMFVSSSFPDTGDMDMRYEN